MHPSTDFYGVFLDFSSAFVGVAGWDAILTATVVPRALSDRDHSAARWFLLHASVNAAIAMLSAPAVLSVTQAPLHVFDPPATSAAASPWPLALASAVHTYYCLGGLQLSWSDWLHHALFVPTLAVPGMLYDWGCLGNVLVFFVCGARREFNAILSRTTTYESTTKQSRPMAVQVQHFIRCQMVG